MNKHPRIGQALLWAAAIIAAALGGASTLTVGILMPALAACALYLPRAETRRCKPTRGS